MQLLQSSSIENHKPYDQNLNVKHALRWFVGKKINCLSSQLTPENEMTSFGDVLGARIFSPSSRWVRVWVLQAQEPIESGSTSRWM